MIHWFFFPFVMTSPSLIVLLVLSIMKFLHFDSMTVVPSNAAKFLRYVSNGEYSDQKLSNIPEIFCILSLPWFFQGTTGVCGVTE